VNKNVVILVPSYQCQETIIQTLTSIQQQGPVLDSVQALFVADDASRDRTAEVALATWSSSVPLKIIRQVANQGEYRNVNEAVSQFDPEVEWFLIMHADNLAKPNWLATIFERIMVAHERVGAIGTSYDILFNDGRVIRGEDDANSVVLVEGTRKSVAGTLVNGCWWHISSCAIRVAAFRAVGGLPQEEGLRLKGDWDFMLRLLAAGWDIQHIPQSLMVYRQNLQGSSSISFRQHADIFESVYVFQKYRRFLNASQIVHWHLVHMWFLLRRAVRSCIALDPYRFVRLFPAYYCLILSALRCCFDTVH
jgi:glycosyltransferase involved in cell wall biosynthesis